MANEPVIAEKKEERHFIPLDLADCKVPVGCPLGADCPEDAFPDHHKKIVYLQDTPQG